MMDTVCSPRDAVRELKRIMADPQGGGATFAIIRDKEELGKFFQHLGLPQSANAAKSEPTKDAGRERQPKKKQRKHL